MDQINRLHLPTELIAYILSFVDLQFIFRFFRTCKSHYNLIQLMNFWSILYRELYPSSYEEIIQEKKNNDNNWRFLFIKHTCKILRKKSNELFDSKSEEEIYLIEEINNMHKQRLSKTVINNSEVRKRIYELNKIRVTDAMCLSMQADILEVSIYPRVDPDEYCFEYYELRDTRENCIEIDGEMCELESTYLLIEFLRDNHNFVDLKYKQGILIGITPFENEDRTPDRLYFFYIEGVILRHRHWSVEYKCIEEIEPFMDMLDRNNLGLWDVPEYYGIPFEMKEVSSKYAEEDELNNNGEDELNNSI